MGCLLSCLDPMERDAGAKQILATEDNSGRLLQNNRDMYGYNPGWWDREGTHFRSRDHAIGTGVESSMQMQDRRLGVNKEVNSDMYGVGWAWNRDRRKSAC